MSKTFKIEDRFSKIAIVFSFISLALGGLFGLLQLLGRSMIIKLDYNLYYLLLTGHGVLLAIVWTAFFIMGLAVFVISRELNMNINPFLLNLSLILSLFGTVLAAIPILLGQANVLYTFYPPLLANPMFYLGAAILVIGTWIFSIAIFLTFFKWRINNKKVAIPLGTFGVLATLIVWLEATPGLAIEVLKDLIPMSLFGTPVDVLEARTYFWYFGHPLVYFWVIPAITLWYYLLPKLLNTTLFSERMAKASLILFIITSTPVGLHHQLVDPGINPIFKYLHTVLTYTVAIASFMTGFNIIATMEKSYREKKHAGVFNWIKNMPWGNPAFSGIALALILFAFGGISGIINTSYSFNYVVHNTIWIVGHFHLMVGTAVTLTFMASSYILIPLLFNRSLIYEKIAKLQPYLWFVGMFIFSTAFHIAGIFGLPRRTADISYGGLAPSIWFQLSQIGALGGIILFISGVSFIFIIGMTLLRSSTFSANGANIINYNKEDPSIFDKLSIWITLAIILIIIAYSLPLIEIYSRGLLPVEPVPP